MSRFNKIIFISLILSFLFMTGCSQSISSKIKGLKFQDVKSARIEAAYSGGVRTPEIYNFDLKNPEHAKIIKNVISYLNSSKVQGNADEKVSNKGGSPTFLILVLNDGSEIRIKPAVGSKTTKLSNGTSETSLFDIPDEVTIITSTNKKPIRILSPEIRKLIDGGYTDIFK